MYAILPRPQSIS